MKILKLGWEFPPLINGGLGIACMGLSRGLSTLVDLEVLVPDAAPDPTRKGYDVLGLDDLAIEEHLSLPSEQQQGLLKHLIIHHVPVELSPYESEVHLNTEEAEKISTRINKSVESLMPNLEVFKDGETYGPQMGVKILEYAKAAKIRAALGNYDVIHAHDWMTYIAGVEIKKELGIPLVVHVHALQYDRAGPEARGWIYEIEEYGMQNADAVISVSQYTKHIIQDHYGIDGGKVHAVHNGADPVQAIKTQKIFPEKVVLFLGRLTTQKGPEKFLEIATEVLEINPDVRFVVAGTGEKLRDLIETGAFRGLGGRFHFTGFLNREKINQLLGMTDVYCMPSASEPFGLSALEAAQFGIPAVISKQSGVAEIMTHALKADYWDTHMMAQQINELLTNEDLAQEIAEKSLVDMECATWEAAAGKVVTIYKSLLT